MSRKFLRFVQCNASGNHCLMDALELTRYARCSDYIEYIISATVVNRHFPNLRYRAPKAKSLKTASCHLKDYYESLGIITSESEKVFGTGALERSFELLCMNQEYVFFAHGTGLFTHPQSLETDTPGQYLKWTDEHAEESTQILKELCSSHHYNYLEACLVRHPSDIIISRLERYHEVHPEEADDDILRIHSSAVRHTLLKIKATTENSLVPVFTYEEIVRTSGDCLGKELNLSSLELSRIKKKLYFSQASLGKRYRYTRNLNKRIENSLAWNKDWLGYETATSLHPASFKIRAIKSILAAELYDLGLVVKVQVLNYPICGQINHHKLAASARVLYSILLRIKKLGKTL